MIRFFSQTKDRKFFCSFSNYQLIKPILPSSVHPEKLKMPKRTQVKDFRKIESADDMKRMVKDKRVDKRASKKKIIQRNRHYEKTLLRNFRIYGNTEEE